jgi:beta-galactosidase
MRNSVSQGTKYMERFSHLEWGPVPWVAGRLAAVGYMNGSSTPVATAMVNTTGPPAALRASVLDGFGGGVLLAGCGDATVVSIAVVDAAGRVHPTAADVISITISGDATYGGASNGDPTCLVNNKSPVRPAFHGLLGGTTPGTVTVTVSAPGLGTASVMIPQLAPSAPAAWCHMNPTL